jgi:hypothetical protein
MCLDYFLLYLLFESFVRYARYIRLLAKLITQDSVKVRKVPTFRFVISLHAFANENAIIAEIMHELGKRSKNPHFTVIMKLLPNSEMLYG